MLSEVVTEPAPAPPITTPIAAVDGTNVAVTARAIVIGRVHVGDEPDEEHAPPQVVNAEPAVALATSVTIVPKSYVPEQSAPQVICASDTSSVTVPMPVPSLVTMSVCCTGTNVAVTMVVPDTNAVQSPMPVQPAPLQPVNV